ncbi:zinc finger protein 423-like [Sitodiplosis mosellana]|uniref:zinc finger protein 423-like n=1 Tax=Sitodiplosis mosellana TaxID=263140 RepID=UPI00244478C6|nr:zinc finger protein 423-like [Sitodiplosis mosellana]XP_055322708.1 zinc finger protein 423-like [Sitodiplosis mosellana]XP_055322709.1 zinc finger protein 423-like [Sitodiplosis mosellana]XP_055322710.1 zinc finger protein 423-like [Sitodiplosis mosellana]XP_055322711.1 zinc finger protein 423-like [Sitodiplosis mosellana]
MMASFWGELDTMQIQINKDTYECRICDNVFTSPIQLTVHCIALHGALPCIHCLKLFESEHMLGDHTRTQHDCDKHICPECSDEFPQQTDFESHMRSKHSKRLCELCELLTSIDEQQQHLSTLHKIADGSFKITLAPVNQNDFRCNSCSDGKSVDRLDKLLLHYLYFHKCSLQSLLRCILNNNMESLQSQISHDDVHAKCSTCNQSYTWSVPKIYHKIYCQGFMYCPSCTNCFDTQEKYDEHMQLCQDKPFKINFCDNCSNSSVDEPHLRSVHNFSTVSWNPAPSLLNAENDCTFCAENLSCEEANLNGIIDHFRTFHNFDAAAILSYLKQGKSKTKTEQCDEQCDKKRTRKNVAEIRAIDGDENVGYLMNFDTKLVKYVYSSASDYDSNDSDEENITRAINTYQCDVCDYRSRSKFVHVMHMHKKHGFSLKTPEFRCNVCRTIFKSNRSLRKHNQNSHHKQTVGKRFKCSFCEFGSNGKTKIRRHIGEHVEASYHPCSLKSIGFNCRYCHFIFWTKEQLNEHQLNRHSEHLQDTYLLCSLCFSSFNNLAALRSHNTTRHFEFDLDGHAFQCKICRIVLFSMDAIRFHMQELHPQLQSMCCAKRNCMKVVANEEELRTHWAAQHTKTVFQCLECFRMFERREYVENHMAVTHAKSKTKKLQ